MDLAGRVAIVTGGASGMGRAAAERLTVEGMRVCVVDVDGDGAHFVADSIGGIAVAADVSDPDQVDAAVSECVDRLGGLDLAYLNAGIVGADIDLAALDVRAYRRISGINIDGVVFGVAAAVRAMRAVDRKERGAIIATSSIAGIQPFAPDPFYTLTKHAVVGFIRAIAPTLAGEGIVAHAICPGLTDTDLIPPAMKERLRASGTPMIPAEVIADTVVRAATAPLEASGSVWACQPGKDPYVFQFRDVPGHVSLQPSPPG